jgi:pimeloyl-ACP methyl ester carboxylesterase
MPFFRSCIRVASFCLFTLCCVFMSPVQADAPERPLVFIPGIVGSVLSEADGDVVWGRLSSLRGKNFHKMDLLPEATTAIPIVPTDVLREIPLPFGPLEIGLYSGILDFLVGKESLADRISGRTYTGDYVEGETLFVFSYDWRRSNFANALALDAFIAANIPTGDFDLIAHSMGGLVSRIMLGQRGPANLCTSADSDRMGLADADFQDLCVAIFGDAPSGSYPSEHLNAPRPSADRLHTFIEMAVPHYGSVNVAATLLEGWGKVSELLLGGKAAIQNTVLSMAAPVELLPTYDNCCARGKVNLQGNQNVPTLDEAFWLDLLLAFGEQPCQYARCEVRRALFKNGIENRKIIDEIMDAGLPATVRASHAIIGRKVKNTREVVYVDFGAAGNGDGVSYRKGAEGDGTVHRMSARLPQNQQTDTHTNEGVVMHAGHAFIVGNEDATNYVFNMLVEPIDAPIAAVSGNQKQFAGGVVDQLGVEMASSVILLGDTAEVTLRMNHLDSAPFVAEQVERETLKLVMNVAGSGEVGTEIGRLVLDPARSLIERGAVVYSATGLPVSDAGIYTLTITDSRGTALAQSHLYVLEAS